MGVPRLGQCQHSYCTVLLAIYASGINHSIPINTNTEPQIEIKN